MCPDIYLEFHNRRVIPATENRISEPSTHELKSSFSRIGVGNLIASREEPIDV